MGKHEKGSSDIRNVDYSDLELRILSTDTKIDKRVFYAEAYGAGEVVLGRILGRYPTGRSYHTPDIQNPKTS